MKYLVFFGFALVVVPLMTAAALHSERLRGLLVGLLVLSTALGDKANINFMSVETYRGPDRGFEVTLTDLIVLALVFFLFTRHGTRLRWKLPGLVPMVLLFTLCIVSTLLAAFPLYGMFTLFKALRFVLLAWCVMNLVVIERPFEAIRRGLIALGFLAAIVAAKQKYVDGLYRIPLLFDHSNTVPLFLNLVVPILLLWGLTDRRLTNLEAFLAIASALGMVFAVVMTYSRAGMALVGAEVLGCLAIATMRSPGRRVKVTSIVVLSAMLVGGAMVADSVVDRVKNAPKSSEEARDEFNVAARLMADDRLLGVGLNNFSAALTRTNRFRAHITVMANEEQAGVAHHIYWLTAAELGWAGLALFLLVIARIHWVALRSGLGVVSPAGYALTGAAIGFAATHLSGFLEWALRITPVSYQFAMVTGLVAGCAVLARRAGMEQVRVSPAKNLHRSGTLRPSIVPLGAGTLPAMFGRR